MQSISLVSKILCSPISSFSEITSLQPYSIPTQFVVGRLSVRMCQPHGLWREAWSVAEPIPVYKQKKLFDDTREAEKVLHYLAGLKTAELGLLVLPVLTHCAIEALQEKHGLSVLGWVNFHKYKYVYMFSNLYVCLLEMHNNSTTMYITPMAMMFTVYITKGVTATAT